MLWKSPGLLVEPVKDLVAALVDTTHDVGFQMHTHGRGCLEKTSKCVPIHLFEGSQTELYLLSSSLLLRHVVDVGHVAVDPNELVEHFEQVFVDFSDLTQWRIVVGEFAFL